MKFNENTIIDNSQSFMTVRHLIIEGSNIEIGKKLAELAIQRHGFSSESIKNENPIINQSKRNYFEKNYNFIELLSSNGYNVKFNANTISSEILKNVDVLVVGAQNNINFTNTEQRIISNWVKNGGSILISSKGNTINFI